MDIANNPTQTNELLNSLTPEINLPPLRFHALIFLSKT
jgi:hypothetical protein